MKLISVKILGDDFRSLSANKLYNFNYSFRDDRLSTKVFAGLNGSGKSNFLELFSEIFYYLEICQLSTVSKAEKSNKNFGFEIEYYLPKTEQIIKDLFSEDFREVVEEYIKSNLPLTKYSREEFEKQYYRDIDKLEQFEFEKTTNQLLKNDHIHVRITKLLDTEPEYCLIRQDEEKSTRLVKSRTSAILPTKVIAYTSGQNELLSNPYYKLKYHYFKEFSKQEVSKEINLAENHRLFFLDYSTNFSIFVANMLLGDKGKLSYLKKVLNVNYLQAFRITINMVDVYKKAIPVSDALIRNITKLKLCTTTWIEKKIGKEHLLILDYLVTSATKEAFEFHFTNAFNLFKVFYELEIMNLFLVGKDSRNLMLRVHKTYNFSDELPKPDPSRLVFRIEKIWINKTVDEKEKKTRNIYYKALSDGEHQFNEVIGIVLMMEQEGCLFLMDEPDTHFNPMWRAKLVKLLNFVAATKFEEREKYLLDKKGEMQLDENKEPLKEKYFFPTEVRNQEIIMTTHSPFVMSDSQTEDVYKFEKIENIVHYDNPKSIETYGASIGLLLKEIFNREISISDLANYDIEVLRTAFLKLTNKEDIIEKIEQTKAMLVDFGESIEKFDFYSFLWEIEKETRAKE